MMFTFLKVEWWVWVGETRSCLCSLSFRDNKCSFPLTPLLTPWHLSATEHLVATLYLVFSSCLSEGIFPLQKEHSHTPMSEAFDLFLNLPSTHFFSDFQELFRWLLGPTPGVPAGISNSNHRRVTGPIIRHTHIFLPFWSGTSKLAHTHIITHL